MTISRSTLLEFLRKHRYAVQSSVHPDGGPQSSVVGIAVSDTFEIVFDTLGESRKAQNLRRHPRIALVIGGLEVGEEQSVQFEGYADEPDGSERARLIELYLTVFPDGVERQSWSGLTYFKAIPEWLRYSDYSAAPPTIVEFDKAALDALR